MTVFEYIYCQMKSLHEGAVGLMNNVDNIQCFKGFVLQLH